MKTDAFLVKNGHLMHLRADPDISLRVVSQEDLARDLCDHHQIVRVLAARIANVDKIQHF